MTTKALREKALSLPVSERLTLVHEIWDSIAEDQRSLPLSDAHARIIDERLAAQEADPGAVVSWAQAKAAARRAVARNARKRKK
jgi:putative addiction module component (TIGR02574 family)